MYIRRAREVINQHSMKLQNELQRRMENHGDDVYEVIKEDPFFAGQVHAISMLLLDLNIAELSEETARDLRRAKRPTS